VRYPATLRAGQSELDVSAFRCTSIGYGDHAQIVTCRQCGHLYTNPTWEPKALLEAYQDVEDTVYQQERPGRVLTFERHLQRLTQHTGPANGRAALDVGAYTGVFVEVARAAGWQAEGVEPSRWAVGVAKGDGLPVREGTLQSADFHPRQFDLITLWDVVEHFLDPHAELLRAHELLRPGGWIALHTMDSASLTARLMGRRWPWFMEMHIHFFTPRTLGQLLERCGFVVVGSHTVGRYLRLGYLAGRLSGLSRPLGRLAETVVSRAGLSTTAIPVNFGDLFTLYAVRAD
jgi:2-polyprenyl-3-methyl-5-hydroxy-6-metoxy-1,4-benzoquinol methylase